jgi:hypothetical protein
MGVKIMKIENDYPEIKTKINKFLLARRIILLLFLISIITVVIVNLAVGGKLWMLYVIGGEVIFYFAFLNYPLVDNSLVKRITVTLFLVCAYLYLIDFINDTEWSYFVIGILAFSIVIIQLLLFFLGINYQRKKLIPLFITSIISTIYFILSLFKVVAINWPIIVLGSISLAALLILFVFYYKSVTIEVRKYFSIR